jgi:hypothetical protein
MVSMIHSIYRALVQIKRTHLVPLPSLTAVHSFDLRRLACFYREGPNSVIQTDNPTSPSIFGLRYGVHAIH